MARRKKTVRTYVLYGCPIDVSQRYDIKGYVGIANDGSIGLVKDRNKAFMYNDNKKPGHGTPDDWIKLFNEDYGFHVHPIFLKL